MTLYKVYSPRRLGLMWILLEDWGSNLVDGIKKPKKSTERYLFIH